MHTVQRFPSLEILQIDQICLHEHHDPQRTLPLMERIRSSGILYNPPLVIPFPIENDHYMVLDGANRVTSLRELGLPHLLVQIVDPNSPGMSLQTWNHVIWNMDPDKFLKEIEEIEGIALEKIRESKFSSHSLGLIELPDHRRYSLNSTSVEMRSEVITKLVKMYSQLARFDRTMIEEIDGLNGFYNQLAGLIIYPPFQISEVVQFCQKDKLLPAGITRFIVSPRALRVNYPLDNLSNDQSLEEKRNTLQKFIQDRLDKKGVRIYTETTVLYDE